MAAISPLTSKVVLLGESSVGKTSIALKLVKDVFHDNQEATIGALYFTKTFRVDNAHIKFDIWDTAGQERYKSLTPMYYRGAHAAIIVYDITNENFFLRAHKWIAELNELTSSVKTIILVGNKCDLNDERKIDTETAQKFAQDNNLLFLETSAKLSTNIQEI